MPDIPPTAYEIQTAGPQRMMELSRGLVVNENSKVGAVINLSSGEGSVTFEAEHVDGAGQKLTIPNLFCIGLPVFAQGDGYRVMVRLRYRKTGSGIAWSYEMYRHDLVFRDALRQACDRAAYATAIPLFYGSPEGQA